MTCGKCSREAAVTLVYGCSAGHVHDMFLCQVCCIQAIANWQNMRTLENIYKWPMWRVNSCPSCGNRIEAWLSDD